MILLLQDTEANQQITTLQILEHFRFHSRLTLSPDLNPLNIIFLGWQSRLCLVLFKPVSWSETMSRLKPAFTEYCALNKCRTPYTSIGGRSSNISQIHVFMEMEMHNAHWHLIHSLRQMERSFPESGMTHCHKQYLGTVFSTWIKLLA